MQRIDMEYTNDELLEAVRSSLVKGKAGRLGEYVRVLLERGVEPNEILMRGMVAGMNEVGLRFRDNEIFVPEVLVASRAMTRGMNVLRPSLVPQSIHPIGRAVLGTVMGDIHDIGKNLVGMFMESKGIEVIDLGTDVPPMRFVQAARDYDCEIVACSSLLTTTMPVMGEVVRAFETTGLRNRVKILIGGAPVTESFRRHIHADVYTPDATSAAEAAVKLLLDK